MTNIKEAKLTIMVVCVLLGMMLVAQFRITQRLEKDSLSYQRLEDLSDRLKQTEKERNQLLIDMQKLKDKAGEQVFQRELAQLKMHANLTPLQGPGVIVTLDDSKLPGKPGENQNLYLIHDDDLLKVINELKAAGAEALSVNEQRLIATSEIRCAGPTVSVNNQRSSPPYVIKAIGDPKTLDAALKMRGGVVETLKFWGIQVNINVVDSSLEVPAYKGTFRYEHAKPVKGGKE
ncbi:DUF881 domain-containing protein [Succinispira mobilis]|uniref:DUF881 domain-containing protein n=1 Tax=Succinispira mobilis TaxID=78120 RepID=UPI00039A7183|nr:DUF881 domain-containing protein [Succinispira mobilis]